MKKIEDATSCAPALGPGRMTPTVCVMTNVMQIIGGKWKLLLLYNLCQGPLRYGELKRCLPLCTEKMLIQTLRELEADGIIIRKQYNEVPPRVEYQLTQQGYDLQQALNHLADWGMRYTPAVEAVPVG